MVPKCSLTGYNPFLQLLGLLFLAFILVIVVIYYLQVYHSSILEKYANGSINPATIEYKSLGSSGSSAIISTQDRTIYTGARLDLVGSSPANIAAAIAADNKDSFRLRDCKVYFTSDIEGCDKVQDTPTKTCSYKFDGWQEFDTYTDNNGTTTTYEKKVYSPDSTNAIINGHLTSKCFKEFDSSGVAKGFEYKQNALVAYDAKGGTNNGVEDANTFGGRKYTSIQFINTANASDNLANVIDSVCSLKYDPIGGLTGKVFYKFIFDTNKNITAIQKVRFNAGQTGIEKVQDNALTDFATIGSHGLRFDNNGRLQVFINDTGINKNMNIFKLNYLTNICKDAQIKDFTSYLSQNVNINKFVSFEPSSATKFATIAIDNLNYIDQETKNSFNRMNGAAFIDFKEEIKTHVNQKSDKRIDDLRKLSRENVLSYDTNIGNKNRDISDANSRRETIRTTNNSFASVMNLTYSNGSRIFNYQRGYKYTELDHQVIPTITNFKTIYTANETFTIPAGGIVCDILLIGGGGGGVGGGGGAGALVAMLGYTLAEGSCSVVVGAGGSSSKGSASTISVNGTTLFKAAGGGAGGNLISYSNYARNNGGIGGCGGGGYGPRGRGGSVENYSCLVGGGMVTPGDSYGSWTCRGNQGGDADMSQWSNHCGGGGGIGAVGKPYLSYSVDGAPNGGAGIDAVAIGGRSYNLKDHFAGGQAFGHNNNGYIGGGGGGRLSTSYATDLRGQGGVGGGGKSNAGWWGNMVNAENGAPNTGAGGGGGGYGSTGGSGIVIIKIVNGAMPSTQSSVAATVTATNVAITHPDTDTYYKHYPWPGYVYIPNNRVQTGIITAFIYLQAGFYRFKADIGGGSKISYAELVIYDESTLQSNRNYYCKKVFKYINSGGKFVPAHLREYIYVPSNKFYKLAYTFKYLNEDKNNYIYENFNLYVKFLYSPGEDRGASYVSLTNGDNSDDRFMTAYLGEIYDNYNQYLFSGDEVYNAYNDSNMVNIFSAITYNNGNNATTLANYLNNNLDYFRINALTRERDAQQALKDGASSLLATTLATDNTLGIYKKLYEDINNINYLGALPLKELSLITSASFAAIFGNNKETEFITYDKTTDTNNLANPTLTPTVFVEVI